MNFVQWIPILRELVGLGQTIAENVRARRLARRAKPTPPPTPAKARTGAKQAPRKDGKR